MPQNPSIIRTQRSLWAVALAHQVGLFDWSWMELQSGVVCWLNYGVSHLQWLSSCIKSHECIVRWPDRMQNWYDTLLHTYLYSSVKSLADEYSINSMCQQILQAPLLRSRWAEIMSSRSSINRSYIFSTFLYFRMYRPHFKSIRFNNRIFCCCCFVDSEWLPGIRVLHPHPTLWSLSRCSISTISSLRLLWIISILIY